MLKLIQISDCHLRSPGQLILGSDPTARLRACIADINENHPDAALCVLTGDLTDRGDVVSYRLLEELLAALVIPHRFLLGNHDSVAAFAEAYPKAVLDETSSLQTFVDVAAGRLLFLDTTTPGEHAGSYSEERLRWLRARLDEIGTGTPVYVFAHHPPFDIELPRIDQFRLIDPDADRLGDTLRAHGGVRHMFFGHVHRPVCGSWRGIPFSALRGTNQQTWLDFSTGPENIVSLEPPAYAVIFIDHDRTIIHFHDFLDQSPKYVVDPVTAVATPLDRDVQP